MTNPIQSVGQVWSQMGVQSQFGSSTAAGPSQAPGTTFKDTLSRALGDVQGMQDDAGKAVDAFLRGEPVELHDVMAAVEEAGIALDMLIQVRDRMIEAYRTVVNMQT